MAFQPAADDVLPLVARLSPGERMRLIRLLTEQPTDDASAYEAAPPRVDEFGGGDNALAWDAGGWDEFQ